MTKRLRLVSAVVHLNLVVDDGEHLTPATAQPVQVLPADLDDVAEKIRSDLAEAELALNAEPPEA